MKTYFLLMDGPLKHRLMAVNDASSKMFMAQRLAPPAWSNVEGQSIARKDIVYHPVIELRAFLPDGSTVFPACSEHNTDVMQELIRAFAVNDILKD